MNFRFQTPALQRTQCGARVSDFRLIIWAFVATVIVATFFAAPLDAQGPNIDDQVNRIAKELYCPVCPNTPLDVCNTQACVQWRGQIKEMLIAGKSEAQIREYFIGQYGDRVLGAPPAEGFNWLAYILPVVGVIFGGTIAWFALKNRLARTATASPKAMPIAREYADRIEAELKEK